LTYAFLHEGGADAREFTHIFFNMFALYMCGGTLEQFWGRPALAITIS